MLLAGLLSVSSFWSNSSWALGLGEIHLNSGLNEPLNADIDIIAATPEELTALRASLAPREAFTRYGIDRPPFLTSFTFKVGKSKEGHDVLIVRSTDSIPEPFVTFLVDVNWARGHLMREYTVLLDPPVYTPGENAGSSAPVTAPSTASTSSPQTPAPSAAATAESTAVPSPSSAATSEPTPLPKSGRHSRSRRSSGSGSPAASSAPAPVAAAPSAPAESAPPAEAAPEAAGGMPSTVTVAKGDTLTKIAHSLRAESRADLDQTMIALYRANPSAFGGNINVLRQGAVLRVPGADDIAALNQKEAMGEVHRQLDAWRSSAGAGDSGGHLRLVSPSAGGTGAAAAIASTPSSGNSSETQALRDRVKDLEGQLAESKRLIDIRNAELAELQHKAGGTPAAKTPPPVIQPLPPPPAVTNTPPASATQATPPPAPPAQVASPPPAPPEASAPAPTPPPAQPVAKKPVAVKPPASGSWLDWIEDNWQVPLAVLLAIILALVFVAWRKRKNSSGGSMNDLGSVLDETHVSDMNESAARLSAMRNSRSNESIVVEETGQHPAPDFTAETGRFGDTGELRTVSPEDTMSSESAVNLDQGDPLAEADFHMAYGLYDQAADLVRIALEREPERRDLRMKLLEIYFVWGNKDAFLQTAKELAQTRDQAPAGEWDKIVIMGKQICPGEALFAASAGSGRGAGALVDLNLEGGENRVDIDLFGDPEGERSHDETRVNEDTASTNESPQLHASQDLDFSLDTPDRGSDMGRPRDEPTIETEIASFTDAPTTESPVLKTTEMRSPKMPPQRADQTAEVPIDDLGLHLDHLDPLEESNSPSVTSVDSISPLEETDHPADAPTMVAGLDERSRRMMEEAASNARDRDLTELERELEASFIADLEIPQEEIKTAVLPPESAPTVLMPREQNQSTATQRVKPSVEFSDIRDPDKVDIDSTSKLRGINADSIDLDLDRLATALGSGDTVEQPRAAEEVFSNEVFEASQRSRRVDLDVGEAMNGSEHPTNKFQASTNKMKAVELPIVELEPVTMSEVGTKLDLARAYMDMGDPEGARSILEEVVQEGSASQKQEASRLIESLPG
jgi:pilus assembly protein FimV